MSIKQSFKVEIEIITPLHVGSGNKLIMDQDYFVEDSIVRVVTLDNLLKRFSNDREALSRIGSKLARGESLREDYNRVKDSIDVKYSLRNEEGVTAKEIVEQYKLPDFKPAIPGSSLKGAIRTVLLHYVLKENGRLKDIILRDKPNKKDTASNIVFGEDAHFDPMRALITDDFVTSLDCLSLVKVKVFDAKFDGSYGWKSFTSRCIEERISDATPIIIEAIKPGSKLQGTIAIDTFVLSKLKEKNRLGLFYEPFSDFYGEFLRIANEYSSNVAEREIAFLKPFNRFGELDRVLRFLDQLSKFASKEKDMIYLRLAWGIGWKGMTGDYLSEEEIEKIKEIFHLGRSGSKTFPKTRKFVTHLKNGREIPLYPAGWIRMRRIG